MSARTGIMEMPDAREHLEKLDEAMKRLHKASQVYVAKRREFSQVRCDLSIMARHLKLLYRFFNEDGAKGEDVVERLHKLNLLGLEMLQLHVEVDKEMAPVDSRYKECIEQVQVLRRQASRATGA